MARGQRRRRVCLSALPRSAPQRGWRLRLPGRDTRRVCTKGVRRMGRESAHCPGSHGAPLRLSLAGPWLAWRQRRREGPQPVPPRSPGRRCQTRPCQRDWASLPRSRCHPSRQRQTVWRLCSRTRPRRVPCCPHRLQLRHQRGLGQAWRWVRQWQALLPEPQAWRQRRRAERLRQGPSRVRRAPCWRESHTRRAWCPQRHRQPRLSPPGARRRRRSEAPQPEPQRA
mmetsp:Transcript_24656/g.76817  ORF Transcript_24656/g.76817 Transcript_24656/m.76817 type:complete len:226 (+) Transcript_24656:318-995(+)